MCIWMYCVCIVVGECVCVVVVAIVHVCVSVGLDGEGEFGWEGWGVGWAKWGNYQNFFIFRFLKFSFDFSIIINQSNTI